MLKKNVRLVGIVLLFQRIEEIQLNTVPRIVWAKQMVREVKYSIVEN